METKNVLQNTFSDGLNTDLHELVTPDTVLTDCVNGTLITYQGNEYVLQNDQGNISLDKSYLPVDYVPVGFKEHNGIIYIVSHNPITNKSQIGTYPSPEYTSVTTNNSITREDLDVQIYKWEPDSASTSESENSQPQTVAEKVFYDYENTYNNWLKTQQEGSTNIDTQEDSSSSDCYAQTYYKFHQQDVYITDTTENNYLNPGDQITINLSDSETSEPDSNNDNSANKLLTPKYPFQKRNYYTISKANYTNSINELIQKSTNGDITLNSNGYVKCKSEVIDAQSSINVELVSYPTEYYMDNGVEKVYGKLNIVVTANIAPTQSSFLLYTEDGYKEIPISSNILKLACRITKNTNEENKTSIYDSIGNAQKSGDAYSFSNTELIEIDFETNKITVEIIPYLYYDNYLLYFDTGYYSWYVEKNWDYTLRTDDIFEQLNIFQYKFVKSNNIPTKIYVKYAGDFSGFDIGELKPKLYSLTWDKNNENGDSTLSLGNYIEPDGEPSYDGTDRYYEAIFSCSSLTDIISPTQRAVSPYEVGPVDKKPFPGIGDDTNINIPPVLIPEDGFIIDDSDINIPKLDLPTDIFTSVTILNNSYFRQNISIFRLENNSGKVLCSEIVYPIWIEEYLEDSNGIELSNYNTKPLNELLNYLPENNDVETDNNIEWKLSCELDIDDTTLKIYGYDRRENGVDETRTTQSNIRFIKPSKFICTNNENSWMKLWERGNCSTNKESLNYGDYITNDNNSWLQVEHINNLGYEISNNMDPVLVTESNVRLYSRHYLLEIFPFEVAEQPSIISTNDKNVLNNFIKFVHGEENVNKVDVIRARNTGGRDTEYKVRRETWSLIKSNNDYDWVQSSAQDFTPITNGSGLKDWFSNQDRLKNFMLWAADDRKVSNQIVFKDPTEGSKYYGQISYTSLLGKINTEEKDTTYTILGLYPRSYNQLPISFDCRKQDSRNLITYLGTSIYRLKEEAQVLPNNYLWNLTNPNKINLRSDPLLTINLVLYNKSILESELEPLVNNANKIINLKLNNIIQKNNLIIKDVYESKWINKTINLELLQLDTDKLLEDNSVKYSTSGVYIDYIKDKIVYENGDWIFNYSTFFSDASSPWRVYTLARLPNHTQMTTNLKNIWTIDSQSWRIPYNRNIGDSSWEVIYFSQIPIYYKTLPIFNQKIEPDDICLAVLSNECVKPQEGEEDDF